MIPCLLSTLIETHCDPDSVSEEAIAEQIAGRRRVQGLPPGPCPTDRRLQGRAQVPVREGGHFRRGEIHRDQARLAPALPQGDATPADFPTGECR